MKATHAKTSESGEIFSEEFSYGTERLLLYLTLGAGYAFLGFFGWLLTL